MQHLVVVLFLRQIDSLTANSTSNLFLNRLRRLPQTSLVVNRTLLRTTQDVVQRLYLQRRRRRQESPKRVGSNILYRRYIIQVFQIVDGGVLE